MLYSTLASMKNLNVKTLVDIMKSSIKAQWQSMLNNGTIPTIEYLLDNGSGDDYLIVDFEYTDDGIVFTFDSEGLEVWFSGDIEKLHHNAYLMPFDDCFENLDYYLQEINQEIIEGVLIPNELLTGD